MSSFKYIGPDYKICITTNSGKNVKPRDWSEEVAKRNIIMHPELAPFFSFGTPETEEDPPTSSKKNKL